MGLIWPEQWAIELMDMDPLLFEDANQWDKIQLSDSVCIVIQPFLQILRRVGKLQYVKSQDFLDNLQGLEYASTAAVMQRPIGSPFVSIWVCAKYISQK